MDRLGRARPWYQRTLVWVVPVVFYALVFDHGHVAGWISDAVHNLGMVIIGAFYVVLAFLNIINSVGRNTSKSSG